MLVFKSVSIMEFNDEESLEVFVRTLPLKTNEQISLLDRDEVIDKEKLDITGCTGVTHAFSIEGEE